MKAKHLWIWGLIATTHLSHAVTKGTQLPQKPLVFRNELNPKGIAWTTPRSELEDFAWTQHTGSQAFAVELGRGVELHGRLREQTSYLRFKTEAVSAALGLDLSTSPAFHDLKLVNGNTEAKLVHPEQTTVFAPSIEGRTYYAKFMLPPDPTIHGILLWPGAFAHQTILDLLHQYHHDAAFDALNAHEKRVTMASVVRKLSGGPLTKEESEAHRHQEIITNEMTLERIDHLEKQGLYPFGDISRARVSQALELMLEIQH